MAQGKDAFDADRTELIQVTGTGTAPAVGPRLPDGVLPPGTRLGRYRIEALLGRGGMGEVYRAQQLEPVRRTVALKVLRAQKLDARHKAYFEVERQVLAQMHHPAIAQIYDADTTPDGHPFFAMEYIDGSPLVRYCEDRALPLERRIELFVEFCEGVQHAHQKGVIHRDLKPGNLLVDEVDGRPHPKIIDFGIAMASSLAGTDEVAGTPDYMSPEQAAGDQALIDTRSDVYSLGVVLCELLTGQRPQAAGETVTDESRTLRLPSEQLETLPPHEAEQVAQAQGRRLPVMRRLLRGELDWVVAKAMRHDRNERYPSAAALADDLRRFLEDRPLQAVPHSRAYVWRKFARRNRGMLAAVAVAFLALAGGLALSLHGLMQARAQRAIAEQRSLELEKVVAFQQSMLESMDIEAMGLDLAAGLREQVARNAPELAEALERVLEKASLADIARTLVERDLLGRAEAAIEREFADQPALAADLREATGRVHDALGMYERAVATIAPVVEYRMRTLGPRHPDTLEARLLQANALQALSRWQESRAMLEAALADASGLPDGDMLRVRIEQSLAEQEALQGELPAARARLEDLLARIRAARGAEDLETSEVMLRLAMVEGRMGNTAEARALMEQVVPLRVRLLGGDHDDTLGAMGVLATMRAMQGDYESAVEMQSRLVQAQAQRLGREHPITLSARGNLANMLSGMGENVRALAEAREVYEARRRVLGPEHPQTLRSALNYASLLARDNRFEEALPLEERVLEARRRILGPGHPDTLFMQINHGVSLRRAGRLTQALAMLEDALPRAKDVLGEKHPQYQLGMMSKGEALLGLGRVAESVGVLTEALELRRAYLPADSVDVAGTAWALVRALRVAGRAHEAEAVMARDVAPLLDADPSTLNAAQKVWRGIVESDIREGLPGARPRRG
jgi:Serine/threonine protein kinase